MRNLGLRQHFREIPQADRRADCAPLTFKRRRRKQRDSREHHVLKEFNANDANGAKDAIAKNIDFAPLAPFASFALNGLPIDFKKLQGGAFP